MHTRAPQPCVDAGFARTSSQQVEPSEADTASLCDDIMRVLVDQSRLPSRASKELELDENRNKGGSKQLLEHFTQDGTTQFSQRRRLR